MTATNPTPTQQGETLEPCWCREDVEYLRVKAHMDHGEFGCRERARYVYCPNCWACGPAYATDEKAIEGWSHSRRAAVAGPRGHAGFIQKVAALPYARVDGDECFYFEKEVTTYCASCHAKYLVETIAATSSPAPADNDAESLLQHVAHSGIEFDDNRIGYVVVQIDRDVWEQIKKLAPTTKEDR